MKEQIDKLIRSKGKVVNTYSGIFGSAPNWTVFKLANGVKAHLCDEPGYITAIWVSGRRRIEVRPDNTIAIYREV